MELSWSSFVLELLNFVVLVWILHRFLYKPVLAIIDRRRQSIEDKLNEARGQNEEAQALKEQYAGRLQAWEAERREAQEKLADELAAERARRLKDIASEIEQERQKAEVAAERKTAELIRAHESQALHQGASFSSRVLALAAGPQLQARLVQLLLEQLDQLADDQITRLREQWGELSAAIQVSSAFEMSAGEQHDIEIRLQRLSGLSVPAQFRLDPQLLAGVLIELGAWAIGANVRDELSGFAELALAGS